MKLFLKIIAGMLFSAMVCADASFPNGCEPLAVQGEELNLKTKKATIVLIHNLTQHDLWITHPVTEASASAGWSSRVQGRHWSALALEKGPFAVTCIESRPGHEQQIPCEGALAVCAWKKATFPENSKGTFWAAEDMSLQAITASLGGRGFVLSARHKQKNGER